MNSYEKLQKLFYLLESRQKNDCGGPYKVGVDLGTNKIALTIVNYSDIPVVGVIERVSVLRDGLLFDCIGAICVLKKIKEQIENTLGYKIFKISTTISPDVGVKNTENYNNVIRAAGFELNRIVDKPVAAAVALGIETGIVVDIGGGTTGVAVLKKGKVIFSSDEAIGGVHLSLVLAGAYKITFNEAEKIKINIDRHNDILPVVRPAIEKMAIITKNMIKEYNKYSVYVVGGTACLKGFEDEFSKYFGSKIIIPPYPLLVTPIGIAMCG